MSFVLKDIEKDWSLFLDRDGVINVRPLNDYVKSWEAFDFIPGVLDAMPIFNKCFGRICIVTNQQGIGKNLMTLEDLDKIHLKMTQAITDAGGRIDEIYYCPDLATKPGNCRKPGLTMAQQAKQQFPEIEFARTIMVGDTMNDMHFGRNAGMKTLFVGREADITDKSLIDYRLNSLHEMALKLSAND